MSFQTMTWALSIFAPVKPKMALLMLANRADAYRLRVLFDIEILAGECGMTVGETRAALNDLADRGFIEYANGGKGQPENVFHGRIINDGSAPPRPPKNQKAKSNKWSEDEIETGFQMFWGAGMRKMARSTSVTAFVRACERAKSMPAVFGEMLARDVQERIAGKQVGFDLLHPSTYLNQSRWLDEKPKAPEAPESAHRKDFGAQDYDAPAGMDA